MLSQSGCTRARRILGPSLLLAYAALCIFLALPSGSRLGDRKVWNSQHNQAQFQRWAGFLSDLGLDVSGKQLNAHLWSFTSSYLKTHNQLLANIRWIPEQLGVSQSWRMFSNPQTHPSRLWLELDEGNGFRPLYIAGSDQHTWRREQLEHHRLRKLTGRLGRSNRQSLYDSFGAWLARQAAHDFPHATSLRIRVYTWSTEAPGSISTANDTVPFARANGKFARAKSFKLSKYR